VKIISQRLLFESWHSDVDFELDEYRKEAREDSFVSASELTPPPLSQFISRF
jgi:hypothetical protein